MYWTEFLKFVGPKGAMMSISKKSDSIFVTDCLFTSPSSKPFTRFEFWFFDFTGKDLKCLFSLLLYFSLNEGTDDDLYLNILCPYRAPDKLRICVFYATKTSKNACIIRSECTFTHTYCCVSKLSKFGAYLYAVDDNTSCT